MCQFYSETKFCMCHLLPVFFMDNLFKTIVAQVLRKKRVKMITYPVILLCPAFYCVQHYIVSSTLLCPTHYCVQQNTVSTLTQRFFLPFMHVLSCCGCIMLRLLAPLFCFVFCLFSFEIEEGLLYLYSISSPLIITIHFFISFIQGRCFWKIVLRFKVVI